MTKALPGPDCLQTNYVDQLAREFLVEVSTRSIQRALKELEEQNQIRREQRRSTDTRGTTGMRYLSRRINSWHGHPRQSQGKFKSERSRPTNRIEPTRASGQVLLPHDLKTQFSERPARRQHLAKHQREMPRSTTSGTSSEQGRKPICVGCWNDAKRSHRAKGTDLQVQDKDLDRPTHLVRALGIEPYPYGTYAGTLTTGIQQAETTRADR